MIKQLGSILWWCVLVFGISACAQYAEQRRFSEAGQPSPLFTGDYRRGVFQQGTISFEDAGNSAFSGTFDDEGFPLRGELRQTYQDSRGALLQLILKGDFTLDRDDAVLGFSGEFVIMDDAGRAVASAEESRWQGGYLRVHPYHAPGRMTMVGKNRYTQYRRDINPAGMSNAFPVIHRGLPGPFSVELRYESGVPRGIVKISTTAAGAKSYVVERQYFNFQIEQEPVYYFYYEPGSFTEVEILGDCQLMPNLTVPQDLLSIYAYDCGKAAYYALSEDFPTSVLEIAAADLDNSGTFQRFTLYHHGDVSLINISVDALHEGQWLRHGQVKQMHYGKLKFYGSYQLGEPIGIGIRVNDSGAKYIRFSQRGDGAESLPSAELLDRINGRYEWQLSRLNRHFSALLSRKIISEEALADLKVKLMADITGNKAIAQDGQVAGLSELWQSWQRQSKARVVTWRPHAVGGMEKTPAVMHKQLKSDIDKWLAQSQTLLFNEAERRCELNGQSFNSDQWQCESRPDARLVAACVTYLGKQACDKMMDQFVEVASQ